MKNLVRLGLILTLAGLMAACSGRSRVPFEIYSDPLGAHVIMQSARAERMEGNGPEWVYLGVTPIKTSRYMSSKELSSSNLVTFKVLRSGLAEQSREWNGRELHRALRNNGMIYWNAQMVPSN